MVKKDVMDEIIEDEVTVLTDILKEEQTKNKYVTIQRR